MNTPRPEVRPQLLITPYKDGKDVEGFLETFENMMWVQNIDEEQWVLQLIPLLEGKARAACAGLEYTEPYLDVRVETSREYCTRVLSCTFSRVLEYSSTGICTSN